MKYFPVYPDSVTLNIETDLMQAIRKVVQDRVKESTEADYSVIGYLVSLLGGNILIPWDKINTEKLKYTFTFERSIEGLIITVK